MLERIEALGPDRVCGCEFGCESSAIAASAIYGSRGGEWYMGHVQLALLHTAAASTPIKGRCGCRRPLRI